jgi:serine/threonine-protein kinase
MRREAVCVETVGVGTVPDLYGVSLEDASARLAQEGFTIGPVAYAYSDLPAGTVINTEPGVGWSNADGGAVTLLVSDGPSPVTGFIPDVAGGSYDYAASVLSFAGYNPGRIDQKPAFVEAGVVMGTRPPAGTTWEPGRDVDIIVSIGVVSSPD